MGFQKGNPGRNRGQGRGYAWLMAHVNHQGDECLIWPFYRLMPGGYGTFGHLGELYYAHRYMCEQAHGPAPEGQHAAHSCGKGSEGCVNPRHLSWKTVSENLKDRRRHGTQAGSKGHVSHLTDQQIAEIRSLKGKMSQYAIAEKFGVSRGCIQWWHKDDHAPAQPGTSPYTLYRRRRGDRLPNPRHT